ncbi:DUF3343 domain-containing protein [Paenibacillus sp. YN15]|uniref:DUF3343 domain-containing protein n=1 Tax=Paenibacillus sp. YN15 TaxID=1742774 RepID=UPI000DCF34C8|nr:DUF3343 domain-containing protein [Paenibacillus sp. YN15]RAU91788.1 hypothetical protein DQG13_28740 [Paenibacillus sp. YN15]
MEERLLMAFDSTQQALRAEMLLEYGGVDIDTRPTPRQITAGCAMSIDFPGEQLSTVKEIIEAEKVEIKGIYERTGDTYARIE